MFVAASTVVTFALVARSRRDAAVGPRSSDVVAEAEALVADADVHQPA